MGSKFNIGNPIKYTIGGILIGMFLMILFFRLPIIRYDLNEDGTVDLKDMVILRNYILEN